MKKTVLYISLVMLAACAGKKALTVSTPEEDVARGTQKYPGYTQADYTHGKSLYEGNCGNCHGLKNPASRNEEGWKKEVVRMTPKANRKAGSEVIGTKEQDLIVKYLVSAGSAPKSGK